VGVGGGWGGGWGGGGGGGGGCQLLSVEYEKNPLESKFDSRVSGKLAPLLIVFDVLLAERVRTWWVGAVGGAGTQSGT